MARVADPQSIASVAPEFETPRASPYLARWSIAAREDDGIAVARATVHGLRVLIAAQDERFVGGSVGASHARVVASILELALRERPAAVVLLLASGGVRLHEANPAEIELARALGLVFDVRAAGVCVIALAVRDVFGGTSVLACAADRVGMLPGTRLGVSGPKVIAAGDPSLSDAPATYAVFGAERRTEAGQVDLVADDEEAIRAWIVSVARARVAFADDLALRHRALGRACAGDARPSSALPDPWAERADPIAPGSPVRKLRDKRVWILAAYRGAQIGPCELHAIDDALLGHVLPAGAGASLIVLEDSAGHETSLAAEALALSRYLAHHSAVLARLRQAGIRLIGVLAGTGHSAAFFANALQARELFAVSTARVMAMAPESVARVTGLAPAELARHLDADPVLGHGVHAFAHWGRLAGRFDRLDAAALEALSS